MKPLTKTVVDQHLGIIIYIFVHVEKLQERLGHIMSWNSYVEPSSSSIHVYTCSTYMYLNLYMFYESVLDVLFTYLSPNNIASYT